MSLANSSLVESHIYKRFTLIKKVGSGGLWSCVESIFALKKIFDAFQHATDAQQTYREIQILKQTNHPNIIKLHQTLKANNGKDVYLLFQYIQSDLHNVISSDILKDIHIRFIIYQVALSLKYLHSDYVIHRDLKPSNLLVNSDCVVKLCDFGLVRSVLKKDQGEPVLTQGVATRWYRAPEVLLGSRAYSMPADVWSFGCIVYEILAKRPLFPGSSTIDQIQRVCQLTGYPSQQEIKSLNSQSAPLILQQIKLPTSHKPSYQNFQKFLPQLQDLLSRMIVFNPSKRITIDQILSHECVKMFYKQQDNIVCDKEFVLKVDDNKKLTVEEYRQMIYFQASNSVARVRAELLDVVGKSSSLKVVRRTVDFNSQSGNISSGKEAKTIGSVKKQLPKNRSFHTFKAVTPVKNQYEVSFMASNNKTQQGEPLSKEVQKTKLKTFAHKTRLTRDGFKSPSNVANKEVKWSPKFLVRKSPNSHQQTPPNEHVNEGSLVQPSSFINAQNKPQVIQAHQLPAKNSSSILDPKKHNSPLNSPPNFVSSKYYYPSMNTVKKQLPNRSATFTNNNESFKSPIKKDMNGEKTPYKAKIGQERKFLSFGKMSTQNQENRNTSIKDDKIVSNHQSHEKALNPQDQKAFKSYQKFPSTLPIQNSPKASSNLRKESNPGITKTKTSYFNSQKYIKPASLIVVNPETPELTKSQVQRAES